jgi:hypothetical protein
VRQPAKERGPNLRFEILDLLAQGRLPDVNQRGRPREVQLLRDCEEIANVTEFHQVSPKSIDLAPTIFWTMAKPLHLI